jgi:hypothetical protein
VIGTRYSGKTTVVEYLKTRGFTVLKLRSGDGINDEDTSTAASSNGANGNHNIVIRDATIGPGENPNAGPSAQQIAVPASSGTKVLDSLVDLAGKTSHSASILHSNRDVHRPYTERRTRSTRLDEEPDTRISSPS